MYALKTPLSILCLESSFFHIIHHVESNQAGLIALVQASPLCRKKSGFALFHIGTLHSQFDRFELLFASMYLSPIFQSTTL